MGRFFLSVGGWKRTRSFQELRHEFPECEHIVNFPGFRAIRYTMPLSNDPQTVAHIIDDANNRNLFTGSKTLVDRLPRAKEPRRANLFIS
jgi:hypothetical protein